MDSQLLAFTGIAAVLTITPGADTMLVVKNVVARGTRAGLPAAFGVCSGLFFHATVSALGLSLILVRSATAFQAVKIAGVCYLILLGCQSLASALRRTEPGPDPPGDAPNGDGDVRTANATRPEVDIRADAIPPKPSAHGSNSGMRPLFEGLLTNLLNPNVAIFYLAFLPQFIRPGDAVLARSLLLAGIHCSLGIVWLSLVTLLLGSLHAVLQQPRVRRGLEATTGAILIAFGARLAPAHR